jgi:hypothetical protein
MAHEVFPFDYAFQVKALGLLFQGTILPTDMDPAYFQHALLHSICESILALKQAYDDPTPAMLETHLLQKQEYTNPDFRAEMLALLPTLFDTIPQAEVTYTCDMVHQFLRFQLYHTRLLASQEIWGQRDASALEQLDTLWALPVPEPGVALHEREFYFSSVEKRLAARKRPPQVLKTLIAPLDTCLADGGLGESSLTTFIGLTSTGKSFSLPYMASVSILQGKKTVFYSLEMQKADVEARLDAQFSGVKTHELREHDDRVREALALRQALFGDNLLIEKLPSGTTKVSDIRADILRLCHGGFTPETIIIDYANRMRPEAMTRDGRHREVGSIFIDLTTLADEFHAYVITAAQVNRTGYQADLLTGAHIAESFEGVMHSSIVISINRTDEEAAQNQARLYLAKDRTGIDKLVIPINTDYARGAFYTRRERA